jgi:outer membrane protein
MKNLSLILNAILILLVGNLYFKQYSSTKVVTSDSSLKRDSSAAPVKPEGAPLKIVYVNADTLLEKYTYIKDQKASLEARFKKIDASLKEKGRTLQGQIAALQEKAQKGNTPPATLQQEEQSIMQQREVLMGEQQKQEKNLSDEMTSINKTLQNKVNDILVGMRKEKGYDFVVSYTKQNSPFLLVNENLEITQEVLAALNKK